MSFAPASRIFTGILLASALAGSAWAGTPANTLVVAKNIDDIITLDPAENFELSGGEVSNSLYTRLVTFEPGDFTKLVGGVAESWKVGPDGKTITFTIRSGLKFQSGRPVTAQDAAWSLQRVVILDKTPAFILTQFGWTKDNVKDQVRALDDRTLEIRLSEAFAPTFVLNSLTAGVASVVDATEVKAHEKDGDLGYGWLRTASAGSGPFRLIEWKAKDSVALQANPDFYRGKPGVDRVVIRHVAESATQRLLLEKGDIDIARNLRPDQIDALSQSADYKVQTEPKVTVIYLGLNQKNPTLAKPEVREALRWLVDYDGLSGKVLKGQYKTHQAFLGSGTYAALEETPFHLDVAKAKELLAKAGLPDGFSINLDVPNTSPYSDVAQSLQSTFAAAGIKVNLQQADQKQVLTKYRARNHDLVLIYWSPDYLDPHSSADYFARNPDNSDGAKNKTLPWRNAWEIPALTAETEAAVREPDAEKRRLAYLHIQKTIQTASPLLVLLQETEQAVVRKNVEGFVSGPTFDTPVYYTVKKK